MPASESRLVRVRSPRGGAGAFTLVEVMISVALVLFLIIGVNQVFKMTTDTIGQGQALSLSVRDMRAAQGVVFSDLNAAVMQNPPTFIIASSRIFAYRNPTDRQTDRDGSPLTTDFDDDNVEGELAVPGEVFRPATYNFRSHRTDRLAFFARGAFRRQTGDDGTLASTTGSNEAYVWYGHLKLPNNVGDYQGPGVGAFATNQNNFESSTWALGRRLILMRDPNEISFTSAAEDHYNRRPAIPDPNGATPAVTPYNPFLTPFTYGSLPSNGDQAAPIQSSRYDLAGTTIAQFTTDVTEASMGSTRTGTPQAADAQWWQRFLYSAAGGGYGAITAPLPPARDYRYEADRYFAKPLDSAKASRLAPIMLNGCSQFIVEYAGDYVSQGNDPGMPASYGDILGPSPDGVTDFVIDNTSGTAARSVRWYGLPRDVAGSIAGAPAMGGPDGVIRRGDGGDPSIDVVPLRDVRGIASPFERYVNQELEPLPAADDSYLGTATNGDPNMIADARYTCVWGPDVDTTLHPLPQMLRIIFTLEDANGRLAEGQQYEFVIDLPR